MHRYRALAIPGSLLFLIALNLSPRPAQAQLVGGTIVGEVVDPTNASLEHATVVIRNEETGTERLLTTGSDGAFSAPSIPVGVYTVSVTHEGLSPLNRTGITLAVWQSIHLHLVLTIGSVEQSVTVEDTPPRVDTSTLQSQGLVNERQVKELPLNGRSFDQLVLLNPASVSYTTQRSGGGGICNSTVGTLDYCPVPPPPPNPLFLHILHST